MINKHIWIYWHQGFDKAPSLIKPCIEQWKVMNPDWEIHLLNKDNVYDFIDPLPIKKETLDRMILPHVSDLIRTQLLIKHGGVWADPTTFPLKPLNEWIHDHLEAGYFFFYKPGRDRIIANWFIASEKNDTMLLKLYNALLEYWNSNSLRNIHDPQNGKRIQRFNRVINRNLYLPKLWFTPLFTKVIRLCSYMVYHYMFYNLMSKHKELGYTFSLMPKLSARKALVINTKNAYKPLDPEIKNTIDLPTSPILKLKWTYDIKDITHNSNLAYLLAKIKYINT